MPQRPGVARLDDIDWEGTAALSAPQASAGTATLDDIDWEGTAALTQPLTMADRPEGWQPADEDRFRPWYAAAIKGRDLDPNPDAPEHHYNYRAAFKAGAWPDETGHWPSAYKDATHPNRFINGVDTIQQEEAPPPGIQLPAFGARDAAMRTPGAPIMLKRPGEVFLQSDIAQPVQREDVASVVGRAPTTLETAARLPQRFAQGFAGGAATSITEPIAAAHHMASTATGQYDAAGRVAEKKGEFDTWLGTSGVGAPPMQTDFSNPQWWAAQLGQAAGSATGLAVIGRVAPEAKVAAAIASTAEAATEASTVYNDLIAAGTPAPQAVERAVGVFASNMVVLGLTDLPLFKQGGSMLRSFLSKAAIESGQEVAQQGISNIATGRPVSEGMLESGIVGGVAGAGFAAMHRQGTGPPVQMRPQEAPSVADTRLAPPPIPEAGISSPMPPVAAAPPVAVRTEPPPLPPVVRPEATPPPLPGVVTIDDVVDVVEPPTPPPPRQIVDQAPAAPGPRPMDARGDVAFPDGYAAEPATPKDERPWIDRLGDDAVASGYPGDAPAAMADAEDRARRNYADTTGQAEDQGDDRALLRFIAKSGGIDVTDADLGGELKRLRAHIKGNSFAGVSGVFRHVQERGPKDSRTIGKTIDNMVTALKGDPRFAEREIRTPQQLLDVLDTAAVNHREGRHQRTAFDVEHIGPNIGIRQGRRWWREGEPARRSENLSPAEDAIQERFARAIEDDLEGHIARYREQFGNVVDADHAKELAGVDVGAHHAAIHAPSSYLAEKVFERVADEAEPGNVLLTAGGPGSGKSSAPAQALPDLVRTAAVIRQSAFADPEGAQRMIDTARAAGHNIYGIYVHTDPEAAYQRQAGRGRVLAVKEHIRLHRGALDTMRLKANQLDHVFLIDNTGPRAVLLEDRPAVDILDEWAQNRPDASALRTRLAASAEAPAARQGGVAGSGPPIRRADDRGPERREGQPAAGEVVDTLDTGEQQARLPGEVGAVRDHDQPPAEFDAPFSLERESGPPVKKPTEGTLFLPASRRGPPIARRADVTKPADGDTSPARRAYDEPPNPPKGITPPSKPVSEVAVVTELARIFGHEAKDVPSVLRGLARKLPVPVKAGVFGKRAFGFYDIKQQVIRLKKFGDLGTFVHELGHDIDFRVFAGENRPVGLFKQELMQLGDATSPPMATDEYRRNEGVAEFFRFWFANPDEAKLRAPQFFTAFEAVLAQNAPLAKQFAKGRIVVQQYLAQDFETRGRARVDFSTRNLDSDGGGLIRQMETLWVDDLASLRQAVEHLAADQPIDLAQDAYALATIGRGASLRAHGFLTHGVRNDAGQFVSGAFKAAIAPVADRLPDFSLYLVARRAIELKKRGIEPGMKSPEAAAILKKYDSEDFDRAADAVYDFQDAVIQHAVDGGMMTPSQASSMRALNREYVPFWRILDKNQSGGRGKLASSRSPVHRIKGSGRDIVDPMQAIVRNTHALVEMVEQHKAMVAFIEQTKRTPGGGLFLEQIPTPQVRTKFAFSQIRDQLIEAIENASGTTEETEAAEKAADVLHGINVGDLLEVFTPATMAKGSDRTISVMHNGQRVFYNVTDPALFEALTAIGPKTTSQAMRWFFKVFGAPARTLRAGATLTFGFIARNPARDTLDAIAQSESGFTPIDSVKGLFSFLKQDAYFQQFVNSGAGTAAMVAGDRKVIARELRDLAKKGTLRDHLQTVAFHPIDTLRALSEAGEMMTRLGEFRLTLRKRGITPETLTASDEARQVERKAHARFVAEYRQPEKRWDVINRLEKEWIAASEKAEGFYQTTREPLMQAALNARSVTVDFARKGSLGGDVNQVAAFFNARVQGYSRLAQTFRKHPVRAGLRVATSITLLSLVTWALNKDDDEYEELPAWQKNTYWHIPLKHFGGSGWLRIPKPFEYGSLFGTTFEVALDQITGRDPHAWKRLFVDDPTMDASTVPTATVKELAKGTFSAIFPTAVLPVIEAMTNYDFFRQKPIVSPFDTDLPPELQYNRWTSETAKVIGRGLGVSPAMIDHLIMGYGAGLARGVVEGGLDPLIGMATGTGKAPTPAMPLDRMPGVGIFFKRFAGTDAQSIADLYRRRDALRTVPGTVKRYLSEGNRPAAEAFAGRYPDRDAEAKRVNAAVKDLGELRDLVAVVYAHQTLRPEEKRELLDRLEEHMVNVSRRALGKAILPSRFAGPLETALARKAFTVGGPPVSRK